MDMTKTPKQVEEYRVQSAFVITIWQGAYRSKSLTISMVAPPCSSETTKVQKTKKGCLSSKSLRIIILFIYCLLYTSDAADD